MSDTQNGNEDEDHNQADCELKEGLLKTSAGPVGTLGSPKEAAPLPFHLQDDHDNQHDRKDDLNCVHDELQPIYTPVSTCCAGSEAPRLP